MPLTGLRLAASAVAQAAADSSTSASSVAANVRRTFIDGCNTGGGE